MRILTRYILREVTAHSLIGVAIFTFSSTTAAIIKDRHARIIIMRPETILH